MPFNNSLFQKFFSCFNKNQIEEEENEVSFNQDEPFEIVENDKENEENELKRARSNSSPSTTL